MLDMLFIDFETRSRVDLRRCGHVRYASDPSTQVLCMAAIDCTTGQEWLWFPHDGPLPADLVEAIKARDFIGAQNAPFDEAIWYYVAVEDHGFPSVPLERWYCTAAQCRVNNIPGSLGQAARFLGTKQQKMDAGKGLIALLSIPQANGEFTEDPAALQDMGTYCLQDVRTAVDLLRYLRPMTREEHADWIVGERINYRGFRIDRELAVACTALAGREANEMATQLGDLTDGEVTAVTQVARTKKWALALLTDDIIKTFCTRHVTDKKTGETQKKISFDKSVRQRLIDAAYHGDVDLPPELLTVMEIIQDGNKTSVSKFQRMAAMADPDDDRIRGAYMFAGASGTKRYSAKGVQPHNFRRDTVKEGDIPTAKKFILLQRPEEFDPDSGVMDLLSRMLRPAIIPSDGNVFVLGDWSAIEARVLPWLADSRSADRVLRVFAQGDDIYVHTAQSMGLSDRQLGKVACIAEGQLVLTHRGYAPIENVGINDKVWDGERFVCHSGLVYKGVKEVITYDGLTATPDHIVFTEAGELRLCDAAENGTTITKSRPGWKDVWSRDNRIPRAPIQNCRLAAVLCKCALQRLWTRLLDVSTQFAERQVKRLSAVFAAKAGAAMVNETCHRDATKMCEPERQRVPQLRRSRGRVPLSEYIKRLFVYPRHLGAATRTGNRPDRQQRALRTGEPPVCHPIRTSAEHPRVEANAGRYGVGCASRALLCIHSAAQAARRAVSGADSSRSRNGSGGKAEKLARYSRKVATYDLVDCGPNHRFTVNDRLVHNCLSLGFQGGVNAFNAMGRNYGVTLPEEQAQNIVDKWRRANPWAPRFWQALERAARSAVHRPGMVYTAGRVSYTFVDGMLGGSLICRLPDNSILTYPMARIESVETPWGEMRPAITYAKANLTPKVGDEWPRTALFGGLLAENATQAVAACLLREALATALRHGLGVVLHTHDEIVCEATPAAADRTASLLRSVMETPPKWATGLPLTAEPEIRSRYCK